MQSTAARNGSRRLGLAARQGQALQRPEPGCRRPFVLAPVRGRGKIMLNLAEAVISSDFGLRSGADIIPAGRLA